MCNAIVIFLKNICKKVLTKREKDVRILTVPSRTMLDTKPYFNTKKLFKKVWKKLLTSNKNGVKIQNSCDGKWQKSTQIWNWKMLQKIIKKIKKMCWQRKPVVLK